jgi:copper transport protein
MPVRRALAALAVWVGVIAGVVAGTAPAASAHALLLRTDPSAQSTVPTSPSAVHLFFSESVEVGAGDVRVYDVNGTRVDTNHITRADGNREVIVGVPHLDDGTYTVTWRAVSADSHPVRGGFVFYVGHPSSISAVPIAPDTGAGPRVGFAYGVDRFLWFASLLAIVGLIVVRRWVWTPTVRDRGLSESRAAERFRTLFARLLVGAWAVLALAGLAMVVFQAAAVQGESVTRALRSSALSGVFHATFGHLWLIEVVLTVVLLAPVAVLVRRTRTFGVAPDWWIALAGLVVVGLCVVSGLNGHARTDAHPGLTVPSIAVHLLAAGIWAGGLGAVLAAAVPSWRLLEGGDRTAVVAGVVRRFSTLAVGSVIAIIATGTVNSISGFHSVSDLWHDRYGRTVALKILLLLVALALAARHRWVTPARLAGPEADEEVGRFQWMARAELLALGGAVALAAALVAMVPGRTLALAASGPYNAEHKAGAYTIQLLVDPTKTGSNDVHVTFVSSSGLAAAEVVNAQVTVTPPASTTPTPLLMQLIGPGHFVGTTTLPDPGRATVVVTGQGVSSTFDFVLHKGD